MAKHYWISPSSIPPSSPLTQQNGQARTIIFLKYIFVNNYRFSGEWIMEYSRHCSKTRRKWQTFLCSFPCLLVLVSKWSCFESNIPNDFNCGTYFSVHFSIIGIYLLHFGISKRWLMLVDWKVIRSMQTILLIFLCFCLMRRRVRSCAECVSIEHETFKNSILNLVRQSIEYRKMFRSSRQHKYWKDSRSRKHFSITGFLQNTQSD